MSFPADPKSTALHYVGIDTTDPLDTLAWGMRWREKLTGALGPWNNLLEPILPESTGPGKPRARRDAGKPLAMELTSRTYFQRQFRDACVLPLGPHPLQEPGTLLKQREMKDGCAFMKRFFLSPCVDKDGLNAELFGAVADVVLYSGHFASGSFYGPTPKEKFEVFHLTQTANAGLKVLGPRWLILSSCTACNLTYDGYWHALLTGGSSLRGVLGFRHKFPGPEDSVPILEMFVDQLAAGKSFKDAWQVAAAEGHKTVSFDDSWAALCHEEAKNDTIADFPAGRLTTLREFNVLRFDQDNENREIGPLSSMYPALWKREGKPVKWEHLGTRENRLQEGDKVEITVTRAFKPGDTVSITVVCNRLDYPQRIDIRKMFEVKGFLGGERTKIKTVRQNTVPRRPPLPADEAKKDDGHDTWVLPVGKKINEVVIGLECKQHSSEQPENGLALLKQPLALLYLRVTCTLSGKADDTPVSFERDGVIIADKG